jgi:rhomboid family protein
MFIPLHDANSLRHIRLQYVTLFIIAANCIVWLIQAGLELSDPQAARAALFSYGFVPAVANGYENLPPAWAVLPEPLTYVTYAFMHGNFMHLAGNMLFIWVFGDNVEDAVGHFRFIFFYLACTVVAALAHSFMQPESINPLIGASGAAAGILAAYLLLHPHVKVWILALGRIPLRIPAMWAIAAWILFQLGNFLFSTSHDVSWAAHIGGLIAGAALIPVLKRKGVILFDSRPVDEVIPPVPPPAVADEGYALPGQPHLPDGTAIAEEADHDARLDRNTGGNRPLSPWGRQSRN